LVLNLQHMPNLVVSPNHRQSLTRLRQCQRHCMLKTTYASLPICTPVIHLYSQHCHPPYVAVVKLPISNDLWSHRGTTSSPALTTKFLGKAYSGTCCEFNFCNVIPSLTAPSAIRKLLTPSDTRHIMPSLPIFNSRSSERIQ
jgi:hypothetical protein